MKRLDEMSLKELKKLYYGERTLRTVPVLFLIPFILALFWGGIPLFVFTIIIFILIGVLCNYGRTCLVKWIIRVCSFWVTVGPLALLIKLFYDLNVYNAKFELTWQYVGGCIIYFGVVIVFTLIPANIFYISFTKNMWGNNHHAYKEISEAYNLAKKGESFADETLPKGKKMPSILANIIAVLLFLLLVVFPIISIVITNCKITKTRAELSQKIEAEKVTETPSTAEEAKAEEKEEIKAEHPLDKLIKLAEIGDAEAMYQLGRIYFRGDVVEQDYAKSIAYFKQAAELKNDAALFALGRMYYYGLAVERNYEEAIKYFQMSAKNGNSESQEYIGQMYFDGVGLEQNYYKAFDYFFKAATKNNSSAQFSVGYMLAEGIGTEKNLTLAIKYLEISAENGYQHAQNYLEKLKKP